MQIDIQITLLAALREETGLDIVVPPQPHFIGAFGAALAAGEL
jgi:activator of 2-hydroxyglutaryl-CoA dehydratase